MVVGEDREVAGAGRLSESFRQLADGRTEALEEIYATCADEVHGLALWRTGSAADAADVVQEVFVRLADRRARLGKVRNPLAYIRRMTHSISIDLFRKRARRREERIEACRFVEAAGGTTRGALPPSLRRLFLRRDRTHHRRADLHRGQSLPPGHATPEKSSGGRVMRPDEHSDLFEGLRVPHAPAELAQRVLDAAAECDRALPRPTIWDRLWESRPLRVAWALATLGLLLAHAGLSVTSDLPRSGEDPRVADRRQAREIRELLALPEVEISPRAEASVLGTEPRSEPTRAPDATGRS